MSEIRIASKRGDFTCPYLPANPAAPAVFLFPAVFGVNSHMSAVAGRLHEQGYGVLIFDYYARSGVVPDTSTPEKIGAAVTALSHQQVLSDAADALGALRAASRAAGLRIGTLGFCVGGTYAMLAACEDSGLSASVNYYGAVRQPENALAPLDKVGFLQAPLLAHFGTADRLISSTDIDRLETALQGAGRSYELFRYRGAPHAFDEDHRAPVFRPVAAQLAWRRTLTFLDWHLRGIAPR